jgi:hypothetical protein
MMIVDFDRNWDVDDSSDNGWKDGEFVCDV